MAALSGTLLLVAGLILASPVAGQDRLDLLEAGKLSQIGEAPRDMLALHGFAKGLGLGGCTWEKASPQQAAMWVSYLVAGMTWAEMLQAHSPTQYDLQRVVRVIEAEGGCEGQRVSRIRNNLVALLEERARPGRIRQPPDGALLRSDVKQPWPLALAGASDSGGSDQAARELKAAAESGHFVLECRYQGASGDAPHRVWYQGLPRDVAAGESAALIAPLAAGKCPASESALLAEVMMISSPSRAGIEEVTHLFDAARHVNPAPRNFQVSNGALFRQRRNLLASEGQKVLECRYVPPEGTAGRAVGRRMQYELQKRTYYWLDSIPRLGQAASPADTEYLDVLQDAHGIAPIALRACPDVRGIRAYLQE